MEVKTDTYQVYTQDFCLLQLCIQHLFCGWVELLSVMLSATHLSWSLIKKKHEEVNKRDNLFLPYQAWFMWNSSKFFTKQSWVTDEEIQPLVWKTSEVLHNHPFQNCPQVKLCNCLQLHGFHKILVLYCEPSKAAEEFYYGRQNLTKKSSFILLNSEYRINVIS